MWPVCMTKRFVIVFAFRYEKHPVKKVVNAYLKLHQFLDQYGHNSLDVNTDLRLYLYTFFSNRKNNLKGCGLHTHVNIFIKFDSSLDI